MGENIKVNNENLSQFNKPKVMFAFVEAGKGHKMPQESLYSAFQKKYGKYCEIIRSNFFTDSNNKRLIKFEKMLVKEVKKYNHNWIYGFISMYMMNMFTPNFLSDVIMSAYMPGVKSGAISYLSDINPDMVVSTHWSTNYYANKLKNKPITITYVPDVQVIPLFRYPSDLTLVSAETGYKKAISKYPKRFNKDNFKKVSFAIREKAFDISLDKKQSRKALGLNENLLTIVCFEGGYGLGKTEKIIKQLIKKDLPINLVAICGTNKKLYNKLSQIKQVGKVNLKVLGYTEKTLEYLSASDVFMGKAGASSVAEATFFGNAIIVTKYATSMEKDNAEYYINHVKNAIKIFNPKKVSSKIEHWIKHPEEYLSMQNNSQGLRCNYGSSKSADEIWAKLCEKYPYLREIEV